MDAIGDLSFYLRLGAAAVAGGILGFVAERRHKPAGLRTHIAVSVGASLFLLAGRSYYLHGSSDPLRVIQGITAGIGFVGAATVLRREEHVLGVSTAANIWVAAALGCEAAIGLPLVAIVLAVLFLLLSISLRWLEARVLKTKDSKLSDD